MAELDSLCFAEGGKVGGGAVVGVSAIAEDLEEGEMGGMVWRFC